MVVVIAFVALVMASCGGGDGDGGGTEPITSLTVKLVKPNSEEVDTTASPIPIGSTIKVTFDVAISDAETRTAIEDAIQLLDPTSAAVPGEFSWSSDNTTLAFTPSKRLLYAAAYTLSVTEQVAVNSMGMTKNIQVDDVPFTTMVKGDVNGDGYADPHFGAIGWNAGDDTGAAYLFNGSADGTATTYTNRITGNAAGDILGQATTTADVNGDGFSDLLIGAPGAGAGAGEFRIYYGSASGISETPSATFPGSATEALGCAIGNAGDTNGDGFDDIVVGAIMYNGAGSERGAVYVYTGSATGLPTTPTQTLVGTANDDHLGIFVAGQGDVNGDGFDDIIASTRNEVTDANNAYVYHGAAEGVGTTANTTLTGPIKSYFGWTSYIAGDFNGDGYDDVAVGAPVEASEQGAAYIYYGSETGIPTTEDKKYLGADKYVFGILAPAGDVNGDGFDDLAIGEITFNSEKGHAFLYLGSASGLPDAASTEFNSPGDNEQIFGIPIPGLDTNGDGFSDPIFTGPGYNNTSEKGAGYIYPGSASGPGTTPVQVTGESDDDIFGVIAGWFA